MSKTARVGAQPVIGHVYFARRGNRLADAKDGACGFRQESVNPPQRVLVEFYGTPPHGLWMDEFERARNLRDLASETGGWV